jgi:hypothetical protein
MRFLRWRKETNEYCTRNKIYKCSSVQNRSNGIATAHFNNDNNCADLAPLEFFKEVDQSDYMKQVARMELTYPPNFTGDKHYAAWNYHNIPMVGLVRNRLYRIISHSDGHIILETENGTATAVRDIYTVPVGEFDYLRDKMNMHFVIKGNIQYVNVHEPIRANKRGTIPSLAMSAKRYMQKYQ